MACEEQETTYWAGITRLDKGSCPPPSSLQGGLALHMPTPLAPGHTPFERPFCVLPHQALPVQCPIPGYFSAPIHTGHSAQQIVALGEYLLSGQTAKHLANMRKKELEAVGTGVIIQ